MIIIIKPYFFLFTFIFFLSTPHFSFSIRPDTDIDIDTDTDTNTDQTKQIKHEDGNDDHPTGVYFGPVNGYGDIPWFGKEWPKTGIIGGGYGGGYGGPNGGHNKNGVIRPSVVCKEKGPCFKKTVTCPAECFTSYSRSGKNFGGGGGGGSCTIDCYKNCNAYC